jgi:hypothetical protein
MIPNSEWSKICLDEFSLILSWSFVLNVHTGIGQKKRGFNLYKVSSFESQPKVSPSYPQFLIRLSTFPCCTCELNQSSQRLLVLHGFRYDLTAGQVLGELIRRLQSTEVPGNAVEWKNVLLQSAYSTADFSNTAMMYPLISSSWTVHQILDRGTK